jgi:hypothetical protein
LRGECKGCIELLAPKVRHGNFQVAVQEIIVKGIKRASARRRSPDARSENGSYFAPSDPDLTRGLCFSSFCI